jgi:hypothetical protein
MNASSLALLLLLVGTDAQRFRRTSVKLAECAGTPACVRVFSDHVLVMWPDGGATLAKKYKPDAG